MELVLNGIVLLMQHGLSSSSTDHTTSASATTAAPSASNRSKSRKSKREKSEAKKSAAMLTTKLLMLLAKLFQRAARLSQSPNSIVAINSSSSSSSSALKTGESSRSLTLEVSESLCVCLASLKHLMPAVQNWLSQNCKKMSWVRNMNRKRKKVLQKGTRLAAFFLIFLFLQTNARKIPDLFFKMETFQSGVKQLLETRPLPDTISTDEGKRNNTQNISFRKLFL